VVVIAVLVLWFARREAELRDARRIAQQMTEAASAVAAKRQQERVRLAQMMARRSPTGTQSIASPTAYGDPREIHRCSYQGTVEYVTGPCPPPWTDVVVAQGPSRQPDRYEQARVRANGEAALRREQQRFNELTAQGGAGTLAPSPGLSPSDRCAFAKIKRDAAYRAAGNNRSFNFIRSWDDYVYNACKNS
jgi:hypothetical protein